MPFGTRSVALTWKPSTDNVGVAGYYLYRGKVKYKQLGVVTRFTDTGLKTGSKYYYSLYAIDAAGNRSTVSNTASGVPK